jgi:hypothetical protein
LRGEFTEHWPGHDDVLMLAEEILDELESLAQPLSRLAHRGLDGLGGVAQPLGRLAGLMQGIVTTVTGWLALRLSHPRLHATVGPLDVLR